MSVSAFDIGAEEVPEQIGTGPTTLTSTTSSGLIMPRDTRNPRADLADALTIMSRGLSCQGGNIDDPYLHQGPLCATELGTDWHGAAV